MNKQLFLGANIAQNTKARASDLANGEVGIFGINSATGQTEKVAGGQNYDTVWLSIGRGATKAPTQGRPMTLPLNPQTFQYKKFNYSPAVGEIKLVSIDCDGSKGQYDVFALRIDTRFGDDLAGTERNPRTYTATGKKFATAREIYDAWVVEINNVGLKSSWITATATDGGVLIQGRYPEQVIEIGVEYYDNPAKEICSNCEDCNSTVTDQNLADSGSGTLQHILELAAESAPYIGTSLNLDRNMNSPFHNLQAEVTTKYPNGADLIYIQWKNNEQPKGDHGSVFNVKQEQFIAFPVGTNTGSIESVLNTLFGTTIKTSPVS